MAVEGRLAVGDHSAAVALERSRRLEQQAPCLAADQVPDVVADDRGGRGDGDDRDDRERLPSAARIDAGPSTGSPGSGTPIDSTAISANSSGSPTWLTFTSVASTCRAYDGRSMPPFEIHSRDPASRARAGVLRTAHGDIRTPAFVPLATKATVRGLTPPEVEALGFDIVLGNTFHLFLDPGHELIGEFGGLHEFMGWRRPIVTDSGGFEVFSMGYGTVADEDEGALGVREGAPRRDRCCCPSYFVRQFGLAVALLPERRAPLDLVGDGSVAHREDLKPPESVTIGRRQPMNSCRPPNSPISSCPGSRKRWNVFPRTMSKPSASTSGGVRPGRWPSSRAGRTRACGCRRAAVRRTPARRGSRGRANGSRTAAWTGHRTARHVLATLVNVSRRRASAAVRADRRGVDGRAAPGRDGALRRVDPRGRWQGPRSSR